MNNELLLAATTGNLDVIQKAIDRSEDLSFVKDKDGNTVFLLAAKHAEAISYGVPQQGHAKIIKAMLTRGAAKDYICEHNRFSENALDLAIKAKSIHAVHALYTYFYKDHDKEWKEDGQSAFRDIFNSHKIMQLREPQLKNLIFFMHNRGIAFDLTSYNYIKPLPDASKTLLFLHAMRDFLIAHLEADTPIHILLPAIKEGSSFLSHLRAFDPLLRAFIIRKRMVDIERNTQSQLLSETSTLKEQFEQALSKLTTDDIPLFQGNPGNIYQGRSSLAEKSIQSKNSAFVTASTALKNPSLSSILKNKSVMSKEDEERARLGEALIDAVGIVTIKQGNIVENVEGVQKLIDQGADVTYRNPISYDSALDMAAKLGHIGIVDLLVSKKACPADPHPKDGYPVLAAAFFGKTAMVKHLLTEHKVSETTANTNDDTIAHLAALRGERELVEYLLDSYPALRSLKTQDGATPLMLALRQGHTKLFIDLTTKYNLQLEMGKAALKEGSTALHVAAVRGNTDAIRFLLDQCKARVHQTNKVGLSAVFLAIQHGQLAALQVLQQKVGFDFTSPRNGIGSDLLQWAEVCQKPGIVAFLKPHFPVAATAASTAYANASERSAFVSPWR